MRTLGPALGLLLLLGAPPAPGGEPLLMPLQLIADHERVSLASVLKRIEARFPGRALDAKVNQQKEQAVYRVKWLGDDGKVREVTVDAQSGKILTVR